MRLTLALILTLLSACTDLQPNRATDRTGNLSTDERAALYDQALKGARLSRERYIATTRPCPSAQVSTGILHDDGSGH